MRVQLKKVIPAVFWPVHTAIRRGTVQEVVAKGGRGSGKSSYLSLELVYQLLRHPGCHAVVLRKVAGTLRNSVYSQIVWAIGALGLAALVILYLMASRWGQDPTPQQLVEAIQPNGDSKYTYSVGYILRNLPRVLKLTVATFADNLAAYLQQALGAMLGEPVVYAVGAGWITTLGLVGVLWLAVLPAADTPRRLPGWRLWWTLGLSLTCVGLCVAACLTWTPLNYAQIFGIQGRYFLPLLAPLLLAVGEWRGVVRNRDLSAGVRLAQIGLSAAVLLEAISQLAAL